MNKFVTLLFTYISYVFAQTCLVDGLALTYTGLTETVNGEQLFLFRCVAEHQMWLSELQKTQSHYIAIVDETQSRTMSIVNETQSRTMSIVEPDSAIGSSIETLFHEKLESERLQREQVKKEKSNLAVIMKDQQKLFSKQSNNFKSRKSEKNPSKEKQSLGVATYTAGVIAIIALLSALM